MKKSYYFGGPLSYELVRMDVHLILAEGTPLTRREINRRLLTFYKFKPKEREDDAPNSRKNRLFASVGMALEELMSRGTISRSEDGKYIYLNPIAKDLSEVIVESAVLRLCGSKPMTKDRLCRAFEEEASRYASKNREGKPTLYARAEATLERLFLAGDIIRKKGYYQLPTDAEEFKDEKALRHRYLTLLHRCGGAHLENFTVSLLAAYYERIGCHVVSAQVTGGSNDGGIDGRLELLDRLGFVDLVLVQTKCRREDLHVTEREVRGFFGAMTAEGGSRGVFATTSVFHEGARLFLNAIPNCVGLDGTQLFELAKQCDFGMYTREDGTMILRRSFFKQGE